MKLYAIIKTPLWWSITITLCQGRLDRFNRAVDYLNVRLNKKIYQQQLRSWELDRRIAAIREGK